MHAHVHYSTNALNIITKIRRRSKCPSMDKESVKTHTHTEYYSTIKEEWNLANCDNMDGLWGHTLSEISQSEKDKYHTILFICDT